MNFRIKHLLIATVIVAIFAMGLTNPSETMEGVFKFGLWLLVAVLVARAITKPGVERNAISAALFTGLTYMGLITWMGQADYQLPTSTLLEKVKPEYIAVSDHNFRQNPGASNFQAIGQFAFASAFGIFVGGLAAYWTRSKGEAVNNG